MQPSDQIIGVKAFLRVLNETLSFAFPTVIVEGEVSSFKVNQGKWVFFDLKDEDATLPCFMPLYQLKVPLEDGMKVRVTGVPKITTWGKFSFTARSITLAGEGELKRAFELLKAKLAAEGLFTAERKRSLPKIPQTIGLITSGQSAAYADFIKILQSRWGGLNIQLADVQVQGGPAPDQISNAISYFNQLAAPVDVLVIIRGGGSLEDLQAFNTEQVVRAVAGSRTPTIVGVGHEVDVSLADFAADLRAATPTDAARLVVPYRGQMLQDLAHRHRALVGAMQSRLLATNHTINQQLSILDRFMRLPRERLAALERLLASFNPQATLQRGYAIVRHNGQVVQRASQVPGGAQIVIQLAEGILDSRVEDGKNTR